MMSCVTLETRVPQRLVRMADRNPPPHQRFEVFNIRLDAKYSET
jgi:hypothetical protein